MMQVSYSVYKTVYGIHAHLIPWSFQGKLKLSSNTKQL